MSPSGMAYSSKPSDRKPLADMPESAATSPLPAAGEVLCTRFEELSREALQAKPSPDAWSRQQVVEHLMLAYAATTRELERRLAKGEPTRKPRSLRDRIWQTIVVQLGYFPPGRKSPDMVRPELSDLPPLEGTALAAEYNRRIAEVETAIGRAEDKWGSDVAVATHPILGPFDAWQWRKFHAVHTLHHVKQMDRIQHALQH